MSEGSGITYSKWWQKKVNEELNIQQNHPSKKDGEMNTFPSKHPDFMADRSAIQNIGDPPEWKKPRPLFESSWRKSKHCHTPKWIGKHKEY